MATHSASQSLEAQTEHRLSSFYASVNVAVVLEAADIVTIASAAAVSVPIVVVDAVGILPDSVVSHAVANDGAVIVIVIVAVAAGLTSDITAPLPVAVAVAAILTSQSRVQTLYSLAFRVKPAISSTLIVTIVS
jgi:hypothetical protein